MKKESLQRKVRKIKNLIEKFEMRLAETDERMSSCSMYCDGLSDLRSVLAVTMKELAKKNGEPDVKLHQDVTITLDLSLMTKKEYQDKIAILIKMSDTCMTTHTYNPEKPDGLLTTTEQAIYRALSI